MSSHSVVSPSGCISMMLLATAAIAAPVRAQAKPGNAVAMIGAGAAVGAGGYMLGVLVARLSAANDTTKPGVRRWPFVAATFAGTAFGALVHALDPDMPSAGGDVAMSAATGAIGGGVIGLAVGVSIDPDLDHNAAPISGGVGTVLGLGIGIWAGLVQRAHRLAVSDALLDMRPGSAAHVALPMPHPVGTVHGTQVFRVGVLSVAF
jgi:hypothetical protein